MLKPKDYNQEPIKILKSVNREISCFCSNDKIEKKNVDEEVVKSFGEEWSKFYEFSDSDIENLGKMYFDIIEEKMLSHKTYSIDIGCGTGRWTQFLLKKIGFMEAVDPSDAIFAADKLLEGKENVRLTKATIDELPFDDETFDFGMSIGVLHHIPDTQKAMKDCIKKIKIGGYFYTYLYYNLDNKGFTFKLIFKCISIIRKVVSKMPGNLKKFVCDLLAVFIYMPVILFGRFLKMIGLKRTANKLPLKGYLNQSFFVIRNDALDRFGTKLEQRFSKNEIIEMMKNSGLDEIVVSANLPYWHAVGKRVV